MVASISVGVALSLTGQFRVQGRQALAGIRAWAEDVNRRGGVRIGGSPANPVRLSVYDDRSSSRTVRHAVGRLIDGDRVDLLIGPYSAVLTSAAAEVASKRCRLLWNHGGASPSVYQRDKPWIVGILAPADQYLLGLLETVRRACPAARSLALARAATGRFPKDVSSGVELQARLCGFEIKLLQEFAPACEDFSILVDRVAEARPDVLVVAGRFGNDLRFSEQLARSGARIGAVAVVAAGVQGFRDRLGLAAEGFVGPSQWEPALAHRPDYGPTAEAVAGSLRRAGHFAVDYPMAQAYAVGVVAQRCVEAAGTLENSALRQAAGALDFTTFYGRFKVDDSGRQVGRRALLVQWQGGRKVILWPPELAQGELAYPWRD